jgi:histidine ammonia-lyase
MKTVRSLLVATCMFAGFAHSFTAHAAETHKHATHSAAFSHDNTHAVHPAFDQHSHSHVA